ncbi:MAG: response regulator transcription factor [Bacteroidia bacterium]|nr:response regulator transcription factor [Bacteroidia bacterium]
MSKIRVAIFDDNDMLRDSISLLIGDSDDLQLVGSFPNCKQLKDQISTTNPHVVVMDIDMPGINGIEGVILIRKYFPDIHILMQTVFDDDDRIFSALKAGASGYILKNAGSAKLLDAIVEVHNGGAPMSPSVAKKVLNQFQGVKPSSSDDYNLSAREREVLGLLVNGKSYKMIADELCISYDTVRAHMKKIYEKLHVSSMTEAVAKAINKNIFGFF